MSNVICYQKLRRWKSISTEKVAKFVQTPICCLLFQSFIFFLSKRVIWFSFERKKKFIFLFFWRDLFYKIDVQRKSQHQEETIFGATIKLKNKERNTKPKPLSLWLYDYFSQYTQHLIYVFVLHNVYFFIAWFFLIT